MSFRSSRPAPTRTKKPQHALRQNTGTQEPRSAGDEQCVLSPYTHIHTHTEGHLIMSASVPAPMLTHSRAKECPRTATSAPAPAHSSPLLKHIHAVVIEKTEIFFSLSLSDYLFGAVSVSATPRSVRHTGSAAHNYRNGWTKSRRSIRTWLRQLRCCVAPVFF